MKGLWIKAAMLAVLCMGASGCRHKQPVAPLPVPPPSTVPLQTTPETPLVAKVPVEPAPLPAVTVPAKKVPKPKKKVAPPVAAAPPVEVASVTPQPKLAIGSLSAGGDSAPATRQRAMEVLTEVDKRIAGLSADFAKNKADGLARVRNFEREAHKALDSGDGEGAVTLATKAKLLLDDLLR